MSTTLPRGSDSFGEVARAAQREEDHPQAGEARADPRDEQRLTLMAFEMLGRGPETPPAY
jgi:hypothetical protein